MTFWDFLLNSSTLLFTGILTFIPLRYDIHDKVTNKITKAGKWFVAFAIIGFVAGVAINYNTYVDSKKSAKDRRDQEEKYSKQLDDIKKSNSDELSKTKNYIVDSMTRIYRDESNRHKKQMDSLESSRQRKFTSIDGINLIKRINDVIKQNSLPTTVELTVNAAMGNEEARIYANEVYDFLKRKGYNLVYPQGSIGDGKVGSTAGGRGFFIIYNRGRISIDVGAIGSRP